MPFQLDGYICLPYSILWGVLGSVSVQWGSPVLLRLYNMIPAAAGKIVIGVLVAVTAVDALGSLIALYGRPGTMPGLERMDSHITVLTGKLQNWISYTTRRRMEKFYQPVEKKREKVTSAVFAQGAGFYKIFLLFFIGAFLGDITETIFCRLTAGVWMSRSSVVWGPFSLVWGIALGAATALLYKYKDSF